MEHRQDGGKFVWRILGIVIATAVVALLGAVVGEMTGSVLIGAVFGGLIGLFGALRSGHVMEEPNVHRPA